MMNDKQRALKRVQMYSFACLEAHLFLNTHPNNRQALDYYRNMKEQYDKFRAEYVARYGMLQPSDIGENAERWNWVDGQWPWMNDEVNQ